MKRPRISKGLRRRVAEAARYRCGYCLTSQENSGAQLEVEHVQPLAHGGLPDEENLWLACSWCNSYKGAQTDAIDPSTSARALLFNPRQQTWSEHFKWSDDGTEIIGQTACGRATVGALRLNNEYIIPARRRWASAGWHPPKD